MAREVELKLEVPPNGIRWLKRGLVRRGKHAQEKDLVSVYFDTAGHKLRKRGMSLRVRHIGDKRVQTIKANRASGAGMFRRDEWEKTIRRDTPDLRAIRHTALAPLATKKLAHALKPVFETRVHRTMLPVKRGQSRIELTLDQGQVRLGRKSAPISEVELELKRGRPADLFRLARNLAERVPTRFALRSKADRGYDLVGDRPVAAVAARKIELPSDIATADTFRTIALSCAHHLAANEPAVSAGDAEGVHQMRVGLRRLRAAIAVFSDLLDDGETARIKAELKWLTNELGPARDLDVYITGSVKPLDRALPATRGIETLQNDLEKRRRDAFARARKAVASARYRALVLETVGWIESGEWTTTEDELIRARRERRADDFAREEIARRGRKVSRRAGKLGKLDARRRHKLRVAIKKLRYAIGFFESLFAGRKAKKRLRRFVRQLKELQDCLGALNDIAVQRRLSGDVVDRGGRRRDRIFAVGVVSGREQTRVDPLRDAAVAAADRFVELHPF